MAGARFVNPKFDFSKDTSDGGGMYRLSRCVLLAHEDKLFSRRTRRLHEHPLGRDQKGGGGGGPATPISGGYHLVWDLATWYRVRPHFSQTGQTGTPLRALIWLAALQLVRRSSGRPPVFEKTGPVRARIELGQGN